ncbi:hypothetical protein RhiLY_10452 [Ceratobasidium sp. AG-Ba]|nr:hypothetical protein RhiLY_10452 [Ceratobasidium sp. AG-Ba]
MEGFASELAMLQAIASKLGMSLVPTSEPPATPLARDVAPPYALAESDTPSVLEKSDKLPPLVKSKSKNLDTAESTQPQVSRARPKPRSASGQVSQAYVDSLADAAGTVTGDTQTFAAPSDAPTKPDAPAIKSQAKSQGVACTRSLSAPIRRLKVARTTSQPYPRAMTVAEKTRLREELKGIRRIAPDGFHVKFVPERPKGSPQRGEGYQLETTFELDPDSFKAIWDCMRHAISKIPGSDMSHRMNNQQPGVVKRAVDIAATVFPELDQYDDLGYYILWDFAQAILRSSANCAEQAEKRGPRKPRTRVRKPKIESDSDIEADVKTDVKTKVKTKVKAKVNIKAEVAANDDCQANRAVNGANKARNTSQPSVDPDQMMVDSIDGAEEKPHDASKPQASTQDALDHLVGNLTGMIISDEDADDIGSMSKLLPDDLSTAAPRGKPTSPPRPIQRATMQSPTHISHTTSTATSTASSMSTSTASSTVTSAPAATRRPPGTPRLQNAFTSTMLDQMEKLMGLPEEDRARFSSMISGFLMGNRASRSPNKGNAGSSMEPPVETDSEPEFIEEILPVESDLSDAHVPTADIPMKNAPKRGQPNSRGNGSKGGLRGGAKVAGGSSRSKKVGAGIESDAEMDGVQEDEPAPRRSVRAQKQPSGPASASSEKTTAKRASKTTSKKFGGKTGAPKK